MQIHHARYFGRTFARPAIILQNACVDFYKIDTRQLYRLSQIIHRPFNFELRTFAVIGSVVGIAKRKRRQLCVRACARFYAIIGQTRTFKH